MAKKVKVPKPKSAGRPLYNGAPKPQPAIKRPHYTPPGGMQRRSGSSGSIPPFEHRRG